VAYVQEHTGLPALSVATLVGSVAERVKALFLRRPCDHDSVI